MAFSTGYNLPGVFRPCSLNTRIEFAVFRNATKLSRVACIASNPVSSTLSDELCLNIDSTILTGDLSMVRELKLQEVRKLLQLHDENDQIQRVIFLDATQRLGLNHHFEEELEATLTRSANISQFHTLHDISLIFRLLRQNGRYISEDVFHNFKGEDRRFRGELRTDVKGLMELYEAAQLRFEGEYILDEAENFSKQVLNNSLGNMEDYSRRIVVNKLKHPYHKSIARFTVSKFHDDLGGKYEWGKILREVAAMHLHQSRCVYQEELLKISKWSNELGLHKKLNLARNRPLEWYTWSMVMLIDNINLSEQRTELTKSVAFIYLLDDIFDVYGTLDELIIFTEAINKWDYAAAETLPDYMKMCYSAFLDTVNGIAQDIFEKYGYNPIDSLKTTWASLCNAFLVEAKWLASGNLPTANEYLNVSKVSSGVHVLLVHIYFLLGHGVTNKGSIYLNDTSELMSHVASIVRLWNDLGCAKNAYQNGKDGSFIDCYRKEHINLSAAQAQKHALDLIAVEWKRLNKECFSLNYASASAFKKAALNFARMVPLMYSYDDDQQRSVLEDYVKFMLFMN